MNSDDQGREQKKALLKKTAIFGTLSDHMLERVANLARSQRFKQGETIYNLGDQADEMFVVVSGNVEHALGPKSEAATLVKEVGPGDVIGWAALLKNQNRRLARTKALSDVELLSIDQNALTSALEEDPEALNAVLGRTAKVVVEDFTVPAWLAEVQTVPRAGSQPDREPATAQLTGLSLTMYRISKWLKSPKPYLMLVGFVILFGGWFVASDVLHWWRFDYLPGPYEVVQEWTSRNPIYGLSFFTPEYYTHIWVSLRRILIAFALATVLGVPVGLFLGWSKKFREYVFPVFETLRPIPILAWVPLSIIMFTSLEAPVLFLTTLASFYATALNTMLGVESIDESYPRAAACLGASRWQVFRHVIIPGSLPYMFTGLQISVGVAWFSLVAAEMVSGEFGLGYVINTSYTMVRYPTIVIGMVTLGVVGYITSAMVRIAGDQLMQWRVRELAIGGQ